MLEYTETALSDEDTFYQQSSITRRNYVVAHDGEVLPKEPLGCRQTQKSDKFDKFRFSIICYDFGDRLCATGGLPVKSFLLMFGLLFVVTANAQEHAPTAAQCQADAAVWGDSSSQTEYNQAQTAFVKGNIPNKTDIAKLGLDEVIARQDEMANCMKVDRPSFNRYYDTQQFYHSIFTDRLFDFIERHNLMAQVKLEDSQGER